MTVTLVNRESGELSVEKNVSEFMNGNKWYWIEYENTDNKKLSTKTYQLLGIEA